MIIIRFVSIRSRPVSREHDKEVLHDRWLVQVLIDEGMDDIIPGAHELAQSFCQPPLAIELTIPESQELGQNVERAVQEAVGDPQNGKPADYSGADDEAGKVYHVERSSLEVTVPLMR